MNISTVTVDIQASNTCFNFVPVSKADRYMMMIYPSATPTQRATKISPGTTICFDNLEDNTFYVYEIQAMNGQTQGDTSVSDPLLIVFPKTTTESAQTEESQGGNSNDGEVTIAGGDLVTSDSKPTITVERVDSLVDLGEKWVDQFVKWHEFTFNKWQSAIERYARGFGKFVLR